jgi:hypothetical protein
MSIKSKRKNTKAETMWVNSWEFVTERKEYIEMFETKWQILCSGL